MAPVSILDLNELCDGMPGIGPVWAAALAEAAVVCFESHAHISGISMAVSGGFTHQFTVQWAPLTDRAQALRSWGDPEEATEFAACGVAALIITALTSWTVVARSRKGTGFDYWLGPKDSTDGLFQNRARLEVSGIRRGSASDVEFRASQKLQQMARSTYMAIPGYVTVVEFGTPTSRMANT
jgi:hypothetical protein